MFSSTSRLSLSVLIVSLIASGLSAAPQAQVQFFDRIEASNTDGLLDSMGQALRDEIDEPVFAAWVAGFRKHLGKVKKIERTSWASNLTRNGVLSETKCKITCEHGMAESRVTTLNGKIVGFNVQSDQMIDWFEGPTSTTLYESLGAEFIERLMTDRSVDARAMCHPVLQEVISAEGITEIAAKVKQRTGQYTRSNVQRVLAESTKDGDYLYIYYEVEGADGTSEFRITIQFDGLKGHLLGFRFDVN